jgi:8-oxo-dGTP pyrophosphatase MutT (NUDIX family)
MSETVPLHIAAKAVVVDPVTERALILRLNENERTERGIDEWHLPGGVRDDPDEPLPKVAQREVAEETGIRNTKFIGVMHYAEWQARYLGTPSRFLALFFELEVEGAVPQTTLSTEHDELAWIGPDDLDKYPALTVESREALELVFIRRKTAHG